MWFFVESNIITQFKKQEDVDTANPANNICTFCIYNGGVSHSWVRQLNVYWIHCAVPGDAVVFLQMVTHSEACVEYTFYF